MPNGIFIGSASGKSPRTVTNRTIVGDALPGEFVVNSQFALRKLGGWGGPLVLLAERGMTGLFSPHMGGVAIGPDQLDVPYRDGDTAFGYLPRPEEYYQARFEAGSYAVGQGLTIGSGGRLRAASVGYDRVVAVFDHPQPMTLTDGSLARIAIPA